MFYNCINGNLSKYLVSFGCFLFFVFWLVFFGGGGVIDTRRDKGPICAVIGQLSLFQDGVAELWKPAEEETNQAHQCTVTTGRDQTEHA